jgi:two-component system response regulator AlgR
MKVLLVDDEPLARERLRRLLARVRPEAEIREADGGGEALALLTGFPPDLVLLDIRMPGVDGIEVAAQLAELPEPPAIIFCSAYDEYAMAALQHQAVAYLLKPVREKELVSALERASRVNRVQLASLRQAEEADSGRTMVTSQTHRGLESMAVDEVRCFIADQKYVTAHAPDRELILPDTLKQLEAEFADRFLRVHRNALVSLTHIRALRRVEGEGWRVQLADIALEPVVSRRHVGAVKKRLANR